MGIFGHRRLRRLAVAGAIGFSFACATEDPQLGLGDAAGPSAEDTDDQGFPKLTDSVLREDFNNTDWIVEAQGIVYDVNLGRLALPVRVLPETTASGTTVFTGAADADGLLEAEVIVIDEQAILEAADAVELRAAREVQVVGRVAAGVGGVTIQAGHRIVITGEIESSGPIRLLLTDPDGQIEVLGRVATRTGLNPADPDAPPIELLGRGGALIQGRLTTEATEGRVAGDIFVNVYGDVRIDGGQVGATADPMATPGRVTMTSEGTVEISGSSRIGVDLETDADADADAAGGDLMIRAASIVVGGASSIVGGHGPERGATISLVAGGPINVDQGARVQAGSGPSAGSVTAKGRIVKIEDGAALLAGRGDRRPGTLRIESIEGLIIGTDAILAASETGCGPGGSLSVTVSGPLFVAAGAELRGGSVLPGAPSDCRRIFTGGRIDIKAREAVGLAPSLVPGTGIPEGPISVLLDPEIAVAPPETPTGVDGFVVSRVIDRGPEGVGFVPVLAELVADTPPGTTVEVGLAGADTPVGPFGPWTSVGNSRLEARATLADHRYVRYRIRLVGRAFDSPSVDYVEIVLRP